MRGRASSTFGEFGASLARAPRFVSLLAQCADSNRVDARYGVSPSARLVDAGEPVPKGGGVYRVGSPYVVAGRVYVPEDDPHYRAEGVASWYGADFHGRATANGEIFDADSISAAHPTLPLPSYVRVTNLSNGNSLIVRVNDRGPYAANRIIDVSKRAAHLVGLHRSRHRLGAGRICRAGADRRLRRPHAGGDAAGERAGAGAMGHEACRDLPDAGFPAATAAGPQSTFRQRLSRLCRQRRIAVARPKPGHVLCREQPDGRRRHRPIPQRSRALLNSASIPDEVRRGIFALHAGLRAPYFAPRC